MGKNRKEGGWKIGKETNPVLEKGEKKHSKSAPSFWSIAKYRMAKPPTRAKGTQTVNYLPEKRSCRQPVKKRYRRHAGKILPQRKPATKARLKAQKTGGPASTAGDNRATTYGEVLQGKRRETCGPLGTKTKALGRGAGLFTFSTGLVLRKTRGIVGKIKRVWRQGCIPG